MSTWVITFYKSSPMLWSWRFLPVPHSDTELNRATERNLQLSSQVLLTTPCTVVGQVRVLMVVVVIFATPFPSLSLRNITKESELHPPTAKNVVVCKCTLTSLSQLLFPPVSFLKISEIKWCRWTITLFMLTYFTQWRRLRCRSHRLSSLMLIRTVGLFVNGKIYCSQHGFCAFMPSFHNKLGIRQASGNFMSTLGPTCELLQPNPDIL